MAEPPRPAPPVAVREATSAADWAAVRAVRQAVFVDEQACPPEEEWDEHDAPERRGRETHHLLAVSTAPPDDVSSGGVWAGAVAGCARWRVVDTEGGAAAKLERFAVLAGSRGQGIGRALVARALADARAAGHRRFVLHAQADVAPLYAAFGFERRGAPFEEAGIEHVKMTLADP